MNLNRIISWLLLILIVPFIAEQVLVLARDPWAIQETYFLFVGAPQVHNATLLILSVLVLILWFTSKLKDTIQKIEAVSIRAFCAVCFYEVVWHFANGIRIGDNYVFTWQWWVPRPSLIENFQIFTVLAIVLLIVHSRINKVKFQHTTKFLVFFTLFIVAFLIQGIVGLDWSPESIRYNAPVLWLATKILGYLMWIFV